MIKKILGHLLGGLVGLFTAAAWGILSFWFIIPWVIWDDSPFVATVILSIYFGFAFAMGSVVDMIQLENETKNT